MNTVVGTLVGDELGHAYDRGSDQLAWSTRTADYRRVQDPRIAITDGGHNGDVCGEVIFLERGRDRIWCVGEVDALPAIPVVVAGETVYVENPIYYSSELLRAPDETVLLRSVALTPWPARIAATPIRWFDGPLNRRGSWQLDTFHSGILERAAEARYRHRHGEPLVIQDTQHQRLASAFERTARPRIEHRSAAAVDVHPARREIDVLIAPAEQPTTIYERGGSYVETFAHGAFAGCEQAPEKVKANLHHERERIVGRAIKLDPWAEAGLEGTIRLAKVRDADDVLGLVEDQLLGVSAGFAIHPGTGSVEHGHGHRRIRRAILDHVALVSEAAYPTATVTAVRGSTPNLDAVLAGNP